MSLHAYVVLELDMPLLTITRTCSGIYCDNCGDHIYGTRVVCMECGTSFTFDFCDKPTCATAVVKSGTRDDAVNPHLPTHDMLKIRTNILHHREIGKVLRNAKEGLKRAKTLLERAGKAGNASEIDGEEHQESACESPTSPSRSCSPSSSLSPSPSPSPGSPSPVRQRVVHRDSSGAMDSSDSESEGDAPVLSCVSCATSIAHPCWYCIDCPGGFSTTSVPLCAD